MGEQPTTLEAIITSFFLVQHWDGESSRTLTAAPTRALAQEALDAIAREPGTHISLWDDIRGLHISESPMVTDAADIAAIVQSLVVPDADEILAGRAEREASVEAERVAKKHRAQRTPADDAGFGWWPQ